MSELTEKFEFTPENFVDPKLPHGLTAIDVEVTLATDESLKGYGYLMTYQDQFTTEKRNFEIKQWPKPGWRDLDPGTGNNRLWCHYVTTSLNLFLYFLVFSSVIVLGGIGDEAGTTEGNFNVQWKGDFYYAKNLAINTVNNSYLDGLGAMPEVATHDEKPQEKTSGPGHIYLWMSDYHPGEPDQLNGALLQWHQAYRTCTAEHCLVDLIFELH